MTLIKKLAAATLAAALCGGLTAAAASPGVRLLGVSSQGTGRTAAVLIEATEPVAYAVSRPDPMTVLVDLRNVRVADAAAQVARIGPLAGVTLEQATAVDGQDLARVRVALASPAAYTVRSARNVIRLDLEPEAPHAAAAREGGTPTDVRHAAGSDDTTVATATTIQKVHASHTRTSTTVTLSGNGRLVPSSLTESDEAPRRLVLDFPNVSPGSISKTSVDGAFVKQVRVALNSRDPLLTRVVMEISPTATYHVERTGADGRDLAVVFEGPKAGGAIMVAPPVGSSAAERTEKNDGDVLTMAQAMANAAPLVPQDPVDALVAAPADSGKRIDGAVPVVPAARPQPRSPAAVAAPASSSPGRQLPPPVTTTQAPQTQAPQTPAPGAQPTLTQEVPGTAPKQYTGPPVSFDFEDSDLRVVLRLFSQISGLNMIIDPAVQGRVNVVLTDVPWDQALEQILRSNKLSYTVDGNIMRIAPIAVLSAEKKEQADYQAQQALAGELQVRTFNLSYAKANDLGPVILKSAMSARGQIQTDTRTNTLILMDLPDHLQTAQSLIGTLDKPQPQVEVEARIVQTSRDFARALGIQWGFNGRANAQIGNTTGLAFPNNGSVGGRVGGTQGPTDPRPSTTPTSDTATAVNLPAAAPTSAIGLALGSINGAFNLDVALTALENTGKGRILSTPRLTTQNNQQAEVAQGVQIPIQTVANNTVAVSFRDATLKLSVTPQITAANTVIMNVALTNETPDFSRQVNGIPPIDTQRATTTVQVNDGATTVIGGIFVSTETDSNDRTPYLYRVPILKWLFQRNSVTDSSRELLIFITPRILRG
ncbi:MAG TPA: type IV pilus secretin PilQ [Vicinamibacterales bacterium]|jgi:type IV pilus assembly protein PilQ